MTQIQTLIQKNDTEDWYRFFRRSRCHETLDATYLAAIRELERIGAAVGALASMLLAYDRREQELLKSDAPMHRRDVSTPTRIVFSRS